MRQRLFIFVVLIVIAAALAGLNAASYSQRQTVPENEVYPDRSSYNAGPTGTRALYSLLAESGKRVTRWEQSLDKLGTARGRGPSTMVMIGPFRQPVEENETSSLYQWVYDGGRLVIVDRDPPENFISTSANWKLNVKPAIDRAIYDVDPSDSRQMTLETPAAKPVHPSRYTAGVYSVQMSRFASAIELEFLDPGAAGTDEEGEDDMLGAPVEHIVSGKGVHLAEAPYGAGRVVVLADPYPLTNGGISLVDNLQLALDLVESGDGVIAIDEFHHGHSSSGNRLFQFFAGTPVISILAQTLLIIGLVLVSKSRRYGRPVPLPEPSRLTKLEYLSAMADLERRTRAFDLAVENVYRDFWRRSARMFGLDARTASRAEMAKRLAERSSLTADEIGSLLFDCEEVIAGAPSNEKASRRLISRIREIEAELGIKKAARQR